MELLKLGADIFSTDKLGYTALHRAVIKNNLFMTKYLLEKGLDVNNYANSDGQTPFFSAATRAYLNEEELDIKLQIIKLLIQNGADITIKNIDNHSYIEFNKKFNHKDIEKHIAEIINTIN